MTRRHDLDALRVLAFSLLILYHGAMLYVAEWDWHLKSSYLAEWLQWPMLVLNRWRMPLLFLISGLAIGLWQPSRAPVRFVWQRTLRILLPLLFGMAVIVPIQAYCQAVSNGSIEPGLLAFLQRYAELRPWPEGSFDGWEHGFTWNHLWYLAYLWIYSLVLVAVLPLLDSRAGRWLQRLLTDRRGAGLLLWPVLPLFVYLWWLEPRFEISHALAGDWYAHALYFTVFVFGYAMARNEGLWTELRRLRQSSLGLALAAISVYLALRAAGRYLPAESIPSAVPEVVWALISRGAQSLYTWTALLALLGWASGLLNRPFRWLPYANEAVLPWYMLHQSLTVLLAYWLVPQQLGPVLEPVLVIGGTVVGCLVLHEGLIRRVVWIRPLFGLKPTAPALRPGPTAVAEALA